MACGVFLGSFDPIHDGHVATVEAGLKFLDRILVVAGSNPQKAHLALLPVDERIELIKAVFPTDRVIVEALAEDFVAQVRRHDTTLFLQGMRTPQDVIDGWPYLTDMRTKAPDMPTIFVFHGSEPWSSTAARKLIAEGRFDELPCPALVIEHLRRRPRAAT
jgi:cytidyltransferase-like protein